jgi:LacI family transcriptional regulator
VRDLSSMPRPKRVTPVSKPLRRRRQRVALLIETSNAYARGLLRGMVRYIREHEPWSFYLFEQARGDDPPSWLNHWDGDGIIARIESRRIAKAVLNSRLPAVDVSAGRFAPGIPWVETDDQAIAQLAASHFLDRGFQHFAYCGAVGFHWSQWRHDYFVKILDRLGFSCHYFVPPAGRSEHQIQGLEDWLRRLPKPIGVFASYDIRGQQILDACRNVGLAVPDEVAVLGVDNDELLCELASPRLSSVASDAHRTGYEAAALLGRMMKGEILGEMEVRIAPLGVCCRESSDVLATGDPDVVNAVRFIREHACESIHVSDVLRAIPLSRKALEVRFKNLLHHTIHQEIIRVKVDRVKELLSSTELTLTDISARTGFEHPEYMSVTFKRETGLTPGSYRTEHTNNARRLKSTARHRSPGDLS